MFIEHLYGSLLVHLFYGNTRFQPYMYDGDDVFIYRM
ncbi:MAG: hypothetical protein PWP25_1789 [Sphaerochaeta sp.]|jgi:hypothetical protein|nr:hypothetical protein [Sphaerochaeta sp.]